MTAFSGKAFQSAMVQGRTLGTFSSNWFWKLEFGKCCSAFSLEVLDICCQCGPVCGQSCIYIYVIYHGRSGRFSSGLKTGPSETG